MASNQDILAFLKADQETRSKEKEEEKEARSKERQEEMDKISDMVRTGVKEEVKTAIQPVEDRLELQEKVTEGLGMQFNSLLKEMQALKEAVKTKEKIPDRPDHVPAYASNRFGNGDSREKVKGKGPGEAEVSDNMERIKEICAAARKVIGFTPIEPKMLELQTRCYGAKNTEEAMLMEIKSYIKCEMKVLPSEIEKLEIVRIFPPAHKEDWDTLYVEFGSEYEVDKLFGYTKVMVKDDHRLVRWYPKEIFERYRAVESVAYAMRLEMKLRNIKLKTRVKVGIYDLELSTKLPNSTVHQTLPDTLPKIELTPSTGQHGHHLLHQAGQVGLRC